MTIAATVLRFLAGSLLATCMAVSSAFAQAQWPSRPVHLIVPFGPGGNTDQLARYLAQHLERALGQPVVVENKPGAGGTIGGRFVAKAPPDGYTLLIGSSPQLAATSPQVAAGYDPVVDLTPVARLSDGLTIIVARNGLPANSLRELQALAARKPESVTCGSAGVGTVSHLHCEELARQLKVKFLHVPHKGSADAMTAVMGESVDIISNPFAVPQIKAGKAKALAAGTTVRHPDLPDVPANGESGFTLVAVPGWFGIAAPAGTPREIVVRIAGTLEPVLKSPDAAKTLLAFGQLPAFLGADEYGIAIPKDRQSLMDVERAAGLRKD